MSAVMEKHLFNLKFASKQMLRDSKKAEKDEKVEKAKLKKAIEKGNMEVARIHAENAIRQKTQSLNFLRMSARVDAVASRVQSAVTTKRVTGSMQGVVKAMDSAMKSMNLEKISGLMDKFEKEFEDLDVQTSVMEGAMNQTTATNVPQDAVEGLMKQAADEAGLELQMELPGAASNTIGTTAGTAVGNTDQDELSQRLARLRQSGTRNVSPQSDITARKVPDFYDAWGRQCRRH
eukprot:snap_masked-scaffold14_size734282-processed-gene-2.15 protein:Tk11292 transcript:snap_masked-scaffold14_size734282-processed-gene-2.15-mRNA-1 annotation:"charged multivesicular body protein 1b-like"